MQRSLLIFILCTTILFPAHAATLQGPQDTIWALRPVKGHLLAASSDSGLHLLRVDRGRAVPEAVLFAHQDQKVTALDISPDGRYFASLSNASFRQPGTPTRLVVGSIFPLAQIAEYTLPAQRMGFQEVFWLNNASQKATQIVIHSGDQRVGLSFDKKALTRSYAVQVSPVKGMMCWNDSLMHKGQGWTLWTPNCFNTEKFANSDGRFRLERWNPHTGKQIQQEILDLSSYAPRNWSSSALTPTPHGFIIAAGHQALNSLLYVQQANGKWQGQEIPETGTGTPIDFVTVGDHSYLALKWPGFTLPLQHTRTPLKLHAEIDGPEQPMSLSADAKYLYMGYRFGALQRMSLQTGQLETLHLPKKKN